MMTIPALSAASVITYTHSDSSCGGCVSLGFPVPLPIDSQEPVAGFRSYSALMARLQDLATQNSDVMSFQNVGKTTQLQQTIWAYALGGSSAVNAEGLPKPAFLQNATIHAREWSVPEVISQYAERLIANRSDNGLYQYLLQNVSSVLIPVLNVDGFQRTQQFPAMARSTEFFSGDDADGSSDTPRDGRMRRKNMRDVAPIAGDPSTWAQQFASATDFLLGVDANRNNSPYWNSGNQNSDDERSLLYHGGAPASENEIQALQNAVPPRLRLYLDLHSYGQDYLAPATGGNGRRDAIQQQIANVMIAVTAVPGASNTTRTYCYSPDQSARCQGNPTPAGTGIGSTDEYFANQYQVPAYTLETEPTLAGLADYDASNVSNGGFILPESQIARVREDLTDATVAAVYRQAGPPIVAAVELRDVNNAIVFSGHWSATSPTTRGFQVSVRQPLQAGAVYSLWIAFNKPMRVRDNGGLVTQYRGQNVAVAPTLKLEGVAADGSSFSVPIATPPAGWRNAAGGSPSGYRRYADDAYLTNFQIPVDTPLANARRVNLSVDAVDFSGQKLDANPATAADWSNGAWVRYEDGNCAEGDIGGADRSLRIVDDGAPICSAPSDGGGGGGGGSLSTLLLAILLSAACVKSLGSRRSTAKAC